MVDVIAPEEFRDSRTREKNQIAGLASVSPVGSSTIAMSTVGHLVSEKRKKDTVEGHGTPELCDLNGRMAQR